MERQPTTDWRSEVQESRAAFLNSLLLAATIGGFAMLVLNYFSMEERTTAALLREMVPFTAVWLIVLIATFWRGLGYRVRAWVMVGIVYALAVLTFVRGGLPGSGRIWLLLFPALTFFLLGPRIGLVSGAAAILIYIAFAIAFSQGWLETRVTRDPALLESWGSEGASFFLAAIGLTLLMAVFNRRWMEAIEKANQANRELEETNVQLHRQASQLQATTEITQAASSILDPETLMAEMAERIQNRFSLMGVYYVGLLLVGEEENSAVLRAATGEAGRLLLDMDYEEPIDESTPVGRCILHREAQVESKAEGSAHLGVLPMPNTRSEIALPLRSRGSILGALNVHSTHDDVFDEADVAILQTLADQVGVALDNAQLFQRTEAALREVRAAHRRYVTQAWEDFLAAKPVTQVDYHQPGVEGGDGAFLREARQAATEHERTVALSGSPRDRDGEEDGTSQAALVVPMKLRGQVIGTLALHDAEGKRLWSASDVAMAETVAEQVALTVENLRLLDETQRRAVQEHAVSGIANRMQQAMDMETLMRITAEELNRILGGSNVYVRLSPELAVEGDESA